MNKNQMNGLYPIIRRVRRPLLPVDWPTDAKPDRGLAAQDGEPKSGSESKKVRGEDEADESARRPN
jgi:hypothetical protein